MSSVLRLLPPPAAPGDDLDEDLRIVAGLRAREAWAAARLLDRHGRHVRRVLMRVLGGEDAEHAELAQDVFSRACQGIGRLLEPAALKSWLTHIAVNTAREALRRRRRSKWLVFPGLVPDIAGAWAGADLEEAARCVYRLLDRLPVDERIPFALRALEGMDLEELAAACRTSVSSVRRRLARAERRFFKLARDCEALATWVGGVS